MRKHRNEKFLLEKEYRRILENYYENRKVKRNLGYYELEEPIKNGFDISWVIREDIFKSPIGWEVESILYHYGKSSWCKTRDFVRKYKRSNNEEIKPYFVKINSNTYDSLYPWAKKWFTRDYLAKSYRNYWGVEVFWYRCTIPAYYLVEKIDVSYITHREIINPDLESEGAYLIKKLEGPKFYYKFNNSEKSNKSWVRLANRRDRRYNKITINKHLQYNDFDDDTKFVLKNNHRHSVWWERW